MDPIRVLQFTDALCVWAYVSQVRVDRLGDEFADQVRVESRFCSVFGDAHGKLDRGWSHRGGLAAYGSHVREVAARFDHVEVHPDVWHRDPPRSSLSCHLFLCGVRLLEKQGAPAGIYERACWALRVAFFRDLRDVSSRSVQLELAAELGLDVAALQGHYDSGAAHAALAADYQLCREHSVTVSPTLILNEGRQTLAGNVGFRVIAANVRELLRSPEAEQSWC